MKKYYKELMIMRGICVLLVIFGHLLEQTNRTGMNLIMRDVIYSFHMPAFFCLSGFFSSKVLNFSNRHSTAEFIRNRALRVLVPYFSMGIVYIPFRLLLKSLARTQFRIENVLLMFVGINPDGALWFLYALFIFSLVAALFVRKKNIKIVLILSFLISVIISQIPDPIIMMKNYLYNPFFYFLGIYIFQNFEKLKPAILSNKVLIGCLLTFVILNYCDIALGFSRLSVFCTLAGILLTYQLSSLICTHAHGAVVRAFEIVGAQAMAIYIFSEPIKVIMRFIILQKLNISFWIGLPCIALITIVVSMAISKFIISKSRILSFLFLGESLGAEKKDRLPS